MPLFTIHVTHHLDHELQSKLDGISKQLKLLQETFMADFSKLQTDIDDLKNKLSILPSIKQGVVDLIAVFTAKVQALQDQIAQLPAGNPTDQATIDALAAEAEQIASDFSTSGTDIANAIAAGTPAASEPAPTPAPPTDTPPTDPSAAPTG